MLHIRDVLNDADVPAGLRVIAEQIGVGTYSQVIAPMLWEGESIGSLYVIRQPAVGFSDKEIGLLRTFADQAVIAIQNARLFNETREALRKVELRTAELSEALDYQTAISDVLRVISQSPTDVTPVFEAILDSASRLFGSPSRRSSATTAGWSTSRRRATGRTRRSPTRAASIPPRRTRRC